MRAAPSALQSSEVRAEPSPPVAALLAAPVAPAPMLLRLQRSIGNRGVVALLRREATVYDSMADVALGQRPAEEAAMAAEMAGLAAARRLSADEIAQAGALDRLTDAQAPRKLLDGVARLGAKLPGSAATYAKCPPPAGALLAFATGDPADPDGVLAVTADGLLQVTTTKRTARKPLKGKPAPPPIVTHSSTTYDLQGKTITLGKKQTVADKFAAEARSAVESEHQKDALADLRASTKPLAGSVGTSHWTLGHLVEMTDPSKWVQVGYLDKDKTRESQLTGMVQEAFDRMRAEFSKFATSQSPGEGAMLPLDQLIDRYIDQRLQPAMAAEIAQAQAALKDAQAAQAKALQARTEAQSAADLAKAPTKGATKQQLSDARTAQAKLKGAAAASKQADDAVKRASKRLDWATQVRSQFRRGIAYILDPSLSSESIAATTVGALCNVLSYYFYGEAMGVITEDFADYYARQIREAHIEYEEDAKTGHKGMNLGVGSGGWATERGLEREGEVEKVPLSDPSRRQELEELLASDVNVAISHQDFNNTPAVKPHHFLLIVRDDGGRWRNLDHTSNSYQRRGGLTDWSRVFRVDTDATLIQNARSKMAATPASP